MAQICVTRSLWVQYSWHQITDEPFELQTVIHMMWQEVANACKLRWKWYAGRPYWNSSCTNKLGIICLGQTLRSGPAITRSDILVEKEKWSHHNGSQCITRVLGERLGVWIPFNYKNLRLLTLAKISNLRLMLDATNSPDPNKTPLELLSFLDW